MQPVSCGKAAEEPVRLLGSYGWECWVTGRYLNKRELTIGGELTEKLDIMETES